MLFSAVILGGEGGGATLGNDPGEPHGKFCTMAFTNPLTPKNKISRQKKIPSPLGQ